MVTRVELSRQAQKDLNGVPHHIHIQLLAWVEAVENEGLENIRKIPGYHDEPLKGKRKRQRSIRLSRSYRAIYEIFESHEVKLVEIKEITKHEY